jgi:alpha-D-ribose 1-methylphosphonate 5-triphosphate synthase subunit PhnG
MSSNRFQFTAPEIKHRTVGASNQIRDLNIDMRFVNKIQADVNKAVLDRYLHLLPFDENRVQPDLVTFGQIRKVESNLPWNIMRDFTLFGEWGYVGAVRRNGADAVLFPPNFYDSISERTHTGGARRTTTYGTYVEWPVPENNPFVRDLRGVVESAGGAQTFLYGKLASVILSLADVVGEDAWLRSIRDYLVHKHHGVLYDAISKIVWNMDSNQLRDKYRNAVGNLLYNDISDFLTQCGFGGMPPTFTTNDQSAFKRQLTNVVDNTMGTLSNTQQQPVIFSASLIEALALAAGARPFHERFISHIVDVEDALFEDNNTVRADVYAFPDDIDDAYWSFEHTPGDRWPANITVTWSEAPEFTGDVPYNFIRFIEDVEVIVETIQGTTIPEDDREDWEIVALTNAGEPHPNDNTIQAPNNGMVAITGEIGGIDTYLFAELTELEFKNVNFNTQSQLDRPQVHAFLHTLFSELLKCDLVTNDQNIDFGTPRDPQVMKNDTFHTYPNLTNHIYQIGDPPRPMRSNTDNKKRKKHQSLAEYYAGIRADFHLKWMATMHAMDRDSWESFAKVPYREQETLWYMTAISERSLEAITDPETPSLSQPVSRIIPGITGGFTATAQPIVEKFTVNRRIDSASIRILMREYLTIYNRYVTANIERLTEIQRVLELQRDKKKRKKALANPIDYYDKVWTYMTSTVTNIMASAEVVNHSLWDALSRVYGMSRPPHWLGSIEWDRLSRPPEEYGESTNYARDAELVKGLFTHLKNTNFREGRFISDLLTVIEMAKVDSIREVNELNAYFIQRMKDDSARYQRQTKEEIANQRVDYFPAYLVMTILSRSILCYEDSMVQLAYQEEAARRAAIPAVAPPPPGVATSTFQTQTAPPAPVPVPPAPTQPAFAERVRPAPRNNPLRPTKGD